MAYLRLPFSFSCWHCEIRKLACFFLSFFHRIEFLVVRVRVFLLLVFVSFLFIYYFGTNFSSIHTPFVRISMKNCLQSINNNHEDKKQLPLLSL